MTASSGAGRPVLILGANSDIARATAHVFARDRHPILLAARQTADLQTMKSDFEVRYQVPVSLHDFDVLAIESHKRFMQNLDPKPHIVISAVGLLGDQAESERDPIAADLVMRTNYIGPCIALEAAAFMLLKIDAPAVIVGISSVAGERGRAKNYCYGSAKAGFSEYLSGLRQKLSRSQVHVVTVKPGFVATKMTAGMDLPKALTASPQDLAALIKKACDSKRNVIFGFKWFIISTIIKGIPENVFKYAKF